jgi:autotransporter-associated beta strand protein
LGGLPSFCVGHCAAQLKVAYEKENNMTKKIHSQTKLSACLLGLFLFTGIPLHAEEKTWTGALDASWANGGNWSPSALLTDVDSVLYDTASSANLNQSLDQNWSITGLRIAGAPSPITILPGSFTLTNAGGIDMSAATADLTILADYYALNNSIWNVAAGRTLTVSNTTAALSSATPMYGNGTVRVFGTLQRSDQFNGITLIADGANITGNPPVRLNADTGSTITVIVTNNSVLNIAGGNSTRIHIGNANLADGTNHLILDGGSINIEGSGSSGANGMFVAGGQGTVGILDINNGTIDMSDRNGTSQLSVLRIGNAAGSRGTVNLNANGILRTPRIDRIDGYAIFNFNGGYLETTAPRDDYFDLVDEVNILSGGAVIDTGDRIIGVAAPLNGDGNLTKLGSGTLTLASGQSYAGQTIVSNGNFVMTLPMSSSALVMETNTTLSLSVASLPDSTWSPTSVTLNGSNALTFSYGISSQPSATLIDTASLSVAGTNVVNIVGTGWGTGTTRLIHYGSMSGGGKFRIGTLPVGLNAKLTNNPATSSIELVVSSGVNSLEWYGLTAFGDTAGGLWDIATSANWDGGESVYQEYGTTNILGDSVNFTPSGYAFVEIATTVRPSSVIVSNLSTGTTYSFMGAGKISGPTSLIKDGNAASSAMTLATQNDYSGGTFIRMGSITLGTNDALPTSGLVYLGSPNSGASLILNGFNQTIGGLIASGSGGGTRRVLNNSLTPSVLTINVAANQTNAYTHTMGNPGAASTDAANNFSIVKTGPGIQSFANCGYGGTTTISGGTLLFNTTATALTGDITVQSGGTLGGNGTGANAIGAPVLVQSGGRLEPGNLGVGTLTVSNTVTLQGETVMELNNTNTPANDGLVANTINFGGTLTVVNVGDALLAGNSFTLFSGAFSGNFANVVLPPLTSGLLWNTNNLIVDGTISIDALPRPSFAAPTFSGNDLILSGTGGAANGTYYILASTNITVPLTNWTVLVTNTFDASGGFSFTNAVNPGSPQQFFTLKAP